MVDNFTAKKHTAENLYTLYFICEKITGKKKWTE